MCIITPSFSGGGAEKVAVNLANQYAGEGIDTSLVVFSNKGPYRSHLDKKVNLVDLRVSRSRYAIFKLRKTLMNQSPTHIISVIRDVNMILGLVGDKSTGCVFAYREANTMHALYRMSPIKRWIYIFLMRIAYEKANVVIANSEDTKNDLIANKIVRDRKVKVIRNPVIPMDFVKRASADIKHPWLKLGNKVVLNVGRLHPQKNHKILIDAFAKVIRKIPGAKLLILGEGAEESFLLERIKSLGLQENVSLVPFQENPFPYYRESDLFVLTSDWEGFGNILVEALACGTPVISTDCPGGPRSILADGKFGVLLPLGDVDRLADAIIEQLSLTDLWNKNELIERGMEFTVEAVAYEYLTQITRC